MYRASVFNANRITGVPAMIAMSDKNYQLNCSESYTGNSDSIIEGYQ